MHLHIFQLGEGVEYSRAAEVATSPDSGASVRLVSMTSARTVQAGAIELEVIEWDDGEPVVFIQTALTADELLPLAQEVGGGYHKIVYHRRGYAGSSPVDGPGSIARDAADCMSLLTALGLQEAHIVGYSYSGAVGLQLAAETPELVRTLTLIEPPPVHTPSADEFRSANDRLIQSRHEHGADFALEEFMTVAVGPDWKQVVDSHLPGEMMAQVEADKLTFFDTDMPALLAWEFGPDDARGITCPALHVGASDSGPWFAEVRELMLEWLPHVDDVVVEGADHWLPVTHTSEVADAVGRFLRTHPM